MVGLKIGFPAGRYHATPWGHHVNEGLVEWPPSPWRLLRALIAAWYRRVPELPEEAVKGLVEKLSALPSYYLPPAYLGHTRHFMPAPEEKTKIFDAFVAINRHASLKVLWPAVHLSSEEYLVLKLLASAVSYLGRAESWVTVEPFDRWEGEANCFPADGQEREGFELVQVLAAYSPGEYLEWARQQTGRTINETDGHGSRHKTGAVSIPRDLFAALHADTAELRQHGWSLPPGAKWVEYVRPRTALQLRYQPEPNVIALQPTVARFAVYGKPLPLLTETLWLGERMRQGLMSQSRGLDGSEHALPIFSGRSPDGRPLDDDHAHAFFLPSDDDGDGRLDHITVYTSGGFNSEAVVAISRLRKLWQPDGREDLYVVLIGLGHPEDFGGFGVDKGESPLLGSSKVWVSRTPFLLTRHPKVYRDGRPKLDENGFQIDGPEMQLRMELARRGFPAPIKVEPVEFTRAAGKRIRWLEFRWQRHGGGGKLASPLGYGFRLTFAEPVRGPIVLGYACHFGLGQFIALKESDV